MAKTVPQAGALSIRVDLPAGTRIGPGKIALLEAIAATGSISAAGRALGMSYKRAWDLLEALNRACEVPVAAASPGGRAGGGTVLTAAGTELVRQYRALEDAAAQAGAGPLEAMRRLVKQE